MTQLETILTHFEKMAFYLPDARKDEIDSILQGLENGEITADKLISDHQKANGVFASNWNIRDIQDFAMENEEIELTDAEAWQIAENIECSEDANEGINWTVIGVHLDNFLERRNK